MVVTPFAQKLFDSSLTRTCWWDKTKKYKERARPGAGKSRPDARCKGVQRRAYASRPGPQIPSVLMFAVSRELKTSDIILLFL